MIIRLAVWLVVCAALFSISFPPPAAAQEDAALPPILAGNFYPGGLTHADLLARLPEAVQKSGPITANETWSGVIRMTGDVTVQPGATLIILPGTLVFAAALQNDQVEEAPAFVDVFNPHDPPFSTQDHLALQVNGRLFVLGTAAEPVIFTSDATEPQGGDWSGIGFGPGTEGWVSRAIVEYFRSFGIGSNIVVQQSILRNTNGCVCIGDINADTTVESIYALTPVFTQNYVYNTGRHSVTIRAGSPIITHNVLLARPDRTATGWEHSALGADFTTCPVIHHNYIAGDQPAPYDGEVAGIYHAYTQPTAANINGLCAELVFEYNTVTGTPLALASNAGPYPVRHNNLLPVLDPVLGEYADYLADNPQEERSPICIAAGQFTPAIGDPWQDAFIAALGGVPVSEVFTVTDNYFGTTDPAAIADCLAEDQRVSFEFAYEPFATSFIEEALPDWHEFDWLAPPTVDLCVVTAANGVNLRADPGTGHAAVGQLLPGQHAGVIGQAMGDDGLPWWALAPGLWVRTDVVSNGGDCTAIPSMLP
ncbi:MAG: hypothetical protein JW910_17780 [Anaerolineae bacterium]|nr:hypothetical protein [Anaerolineae bacterium]